MAVDLADLNHPRCDLRTEMFASNDKGEIAATIIFRKKYIAMVMSSRMNALAASKNPSYEKRK
jgi:hypothetical protein